LSQKNPLFGRLAPRLMFQLVPAVIVSTVGIVLLSSLGKNPEPAPAAAPAVTVIQAEATVRFVPRQPADAEAEWTPDPDASPAKAAAPRTAMPKSAAANPRAQQQRRVATVEPAIPAPAEPPAAPQSNAPNTPAAPATTGGSNFLVTGWRRVTSAAERLSRWAQPPSEWFEQSPPPRPPAPIPERNFTSASLDQ
jgi:hypothetical protein